MYSRSEMNRQEAESRKRKAEGRRQKSEDGDQEHGCYCLLLTAFCLLLLAGGFNRYFGGCRFTQVAAGATDLRDGGDGVLEDQLVVGT